MEMIVFFRRIKSNRNVGFLWNTKSDTEIKDLIGFLIHLYLQNTQLSYEIQPHLIKIIWRSLNG
jgi:hypothetical protein